MKPIATVSIEGSLTTAADPALLDFGSYRPGVKEKLTKLRETHYVVIVGAILNTYNGLKLVLDRLQSDGIPYDEVWAGNGQPEAAVRFDDDAKSL